MDAVHHAAVERQVGIATVRQRRAATDQEKDKGCGRGAAKLKDGGHRAITVVAASVKCHAISLRRHVAHSALMASPHGPCRNHCFYINGAASRVHPIEGVYPMSSGFAGHATCYHCTPW